MSREETRDIPIGLLRRSTSTPREHCDEAALERLAHWIRRRGLLQPILVRRLEGGEFEVVAGDRRLLAAKRAGLTEVTCRVREYPDKEQGDVPLGDVYALEDALVENLVREGLSKLEESEAILDLVCLHVGEARPFVLARLGTMHARVVKHRTPVNITNEDDRILETFDALNLIGWQSFFTHRVALLELPDAIKELLHRRRISYVAAKRIARLETDLQTQVISRIKRGELRSGGLNRELDALLGQSRPDAQRLERLRRTLPKHLENPRVQQSLASLERELGLA
jgi:ParB family transcriptional regulator, chromosome partitioning protein